MFEYLIIAVLILTLLAISLIKKREVINDTVAATREMDPIFTEQVSHKLSVINKRLALLEHMMQNQVVEQDNEKRIVSQKYNRLLELYLNEKATNEQLAMYHKFPEIHYANQQVTIKEGLLETLMRGVQAGRVSENDSFRASIYPEYLVAKSS